jgi:hypothetical protein
MKTMQSAPTIYQPEEDIYDVVIELLGRSHAERLFDNLNHPEFD